MAKKKVTRKKVSKNTTQKKVAKKAAKKTVKKKVAHTSSKATKKKAVTKKAVTKKTIAKKTSSREKTAVTKKTARWTSARASKATNPAFELEAEQSLVDLPVEQLKKKKSGLTKKDLKYFTNVLLEKRAEIIGDVTSMEEGARKSIDNGNLSHMPVHMADVGSDHYEHEFNLGLLESEGKLLREVDQALLRIQAGHYGVCAMTGRPIERARLEIKPWAKYSIEAVRLREKAGLM